MSGLYLIAHLGAQPVAIESGQVESVVDLGEITPVPMGGRTLRGLAALRSRVVTVVSMKAALDLADEGDSRRAVIVRAEGHHYAMLVDALEDIAELEMRPLSASVRLDTAWRPAARGVVERDGEPILVIDPLALLPLGASAAA